VDDGFAYTVPEDLSGVQIGSLVRVPLGGRKVRGFVTALRNGEPDRPLKAILARSGDFPVFDRRLLETARWVATHYVAPLSTVLGRCAPPNLPRAGAWDRDPLPSRTPERRRNRPGYTITGAPPAPLVVDVVAPVLASGRAALVTAPTVEEAAEVSAELDGLLDADVETATAIQSAATRTAIWSAAAAGVPFVIVGTREVAFWGAGGIGVAVVLEEGRRAYKAKQTPTFNVREVLRRRSAVERFDLRFIGPVPSTEASAAGVEMRGGERRVWPLVELADRRADDGGLILTTTRAAIASSLRNGGTVFVLANRRGYAAAFRCVRCRELRRCSNCGSGLETAGTCRRCGTEHDACATCGGKRFEPLGAGIGRVADALRRTFGGAVGEAGADAPVTVGTERDLVGLAPVDLSVAIDADAMLLAPNYRAAEDALRVLVRTALATTPGRGRKSLVQTGLPDHPVMGALRAGRPLAFVEGELAVRAKSLLPPIGELIAFVTNAPIDETAAALGAASAGASMIGPAELGDSQRWLIQGTDLRTVRVRLREVVQNLRNEGWRVRVDADPVDL
jgi:primosomal protein N'